MKNKNIVIAIIAAFAIIGIVIIAKSSLFKGSAVKAGHGKSGPVQPAAKKIVISKDKGGLTVRGFGTKDRELTLKVRAFKSVDGKSSVYVASFVTAKMQELPPGTYDIEIDTIPQKIYKNVKVSLGRETIEDLGSITGSIHIKTINTKKAIAYYPMRILYAKTNEAVTAYMTNRPIEMIPGTYDIEIGTLPRELKKDVKLEPGKEVVFDLGCPTGALVVKTTDENKRPLKYNVNIKRAENNEFLGTIATNRSIEILPGTYTLEIMSIPQQTRKGVVIKAGQETVIDASLYAPPAPPKAASALPEELPVKGKKANH